MRKENTKLNLITNNDGFFITLLLADYQKNKREYLYFSELSSLRYKNLRKDELFIYLIFLDRFCGLKIFKLIKENSEELKKFLNLKTKTIREIQRYFLKFSIEEIKLLFKELEFKIQVPRETRNLLINKIEKIMI
jgi:hypothetical protein